MYRDRGNSGHEYVNGRGQSTGGIDKNPVVSNAERKKGGTNLGNTKNVNFGGFIWGKFSVDQPSLWLFTAKVSIKIRNEKIKPAKKKRTAAAKR